jgi:hypothetical protein
MKHLFVRRARHYYAITFILITVLFLFRNTNLLIVGLAGRYGFSGATLVLVIGISFVMALDMGYKNIYSKCLYPVFVALFAYLVLPIIEFATYDRASSYYFMYYLVLGFFYIFLLHIFVTFFGLGIGVLIRKRRMKKEQRTE